MELCSDCELIAYRAECNQEAGENHIVNLNLRRSLWDCAQTSPLVQVAWWKIRQHWKLHIICPKQNFRIQFKLKTIKYTSNWKLHTIFPIKIFRLWFKLKFSDCYSNPKLQIIVQIQDFRMHIQLKFPEYFSPREEIIIAPRHIIILAPETK